MTATPASNLMVVGVGNTSVQWGYFALRPAMAWPEPHACFTAPVAGDQWMAAMNADAPDSWGVGACGWISVNRAAGQRVAAWLRATHPSTTCRCLTHNDFPMTLAVDFPRQVGLDRVAAAYAANQLRPQGRGTLVVDAGTAITVNAIDSSGRFVGGAILPGARASCQTLAQTTDRLPFVELTAGRGAPPAIGSNTESAIRSGVHWGAVGAVRELVTRCRGELGDAAAPVLLTGGYAQALQPHLGEPVQYLPHLVLTGVALATRSPPLPASGP